jgi:LacI family transcriptional regulator
LFFEVESIAMPKHITLRDVAAHAGVSVTTVSNVVRNWPYISAELRHRVQDSIDTLGYSPHIVAQGLRTGQTQAIAFIVPDLSNPYFAEIVAAAEDAAQAHGYTLLVFNTHEDPVREAECIQKAARRWADGLLIAQSASTSESSTPWDNVHIPVIAVDRIPESGTHPACAVDNLLVGSTATEHLFSLGHRKIAHIAGPQAVRPALDRCLGYRKTLNEHQLPYSQIVYSGATWGPNDGYRCMTALLDGDDPPTAVFASNDRVAIGALHAISERGLRVPRDISLIGVDDIEISVHLNPPLTTMRQPLDQLANIAVEMLLQVIREETLELSLRLLEPELIVRGSTAAPPILA